MADQAAVPSGVVPGSDKGHPQLRRQGLHLFLSSALRELEADIDTSRTARIFGGLEANGAERSAT